MIDSFRCKDTQELFESGKTQRWTSIKNVAERKLQMLDAAVVLNDLKYPPGNRFEVLKGNRLGQYSIRINDQWRICFKWNEEGRHLFDVEIVDYH